LSVSYGICGAAARRVFAIRSARGGGVAQGIIRSCPSRHSDSPCTKRAGRPHVGSVPDAPITLVGRPAISSGHDRPSDEPDYGQSVWPWTARPVRLLLAPLRKVPSPGDTAVCSGVVQATRRSYPRISSHPSKRPWFDRWMGRGSLAEALVSLDVPAGVPSQDSHRLLESESGLGVFGSSGRLAPAVPAPTHDACAKRIQQYLTVVKSRRTVIA
jgi:hypothetical protein